MELPFNLHFQEIFFVSNSAVCYIDPETVVFQSPFSGDFLCFVTPVIEILWNYGLTFQSPFSGDFLCFVKSRLLKSSWIEFFQSPFSGDFLCFPNSATSNSSGKGIFRLSISIFRRFSLFLNWETNSGIFEKLLSISIFRRFSLFPNQQDRTPAE